MAICDYGNLIVYLDDKTTLYMGILVLVTYLVDIKMTYLRDITVTLSEEVGIKSLNDWAEH